MKAIALMSGGLDSSLAAKIIKDLGIELIALNARGPFCLCNRKKADGSCSHEAGRASEELGIKLIAVNTSKEFMEIVKNPKHGYGSNMNPCLDCRILLFKKAREAMASEGASFVITGEVLGQRPMSQRREAMKLIDKEADLEGFVVRPLSAKALEPTIPERLGWIDREKLLSISGRGRREQITLAKELGINDYPCPSGGCLLTDPEFSRRLRDIMRFGEFSLSDIQFLKIGRHFRLSPKAKLVVGRDESENARLEALKEERDFFFRPEDLAGPSAVLRGAVVDSITLEFASRIVAKYCDGATNETKILCRLNSLQEYKFIVGPHDEEALAAHRIN
jgi:tRNA U34 2-thiouridine synthase MnmA/TrmU